MGVNYVIAAWTGGRKSDDRRAIKDRTFMIREHIAALEAVSHSLDQITIVLAEGGDSKADAFIKSLTKVSGVPVKVLTRENTGYSYASWNHAFEIYKETFTHYIIVEDDYMPWVNNFDSILIEHAERDNAYVCGLKARSGRLAAISNGIIPSKVWAKVHPAPYVNGATFREGNQSQRIWTGWFSEKGFPVTDHLSTHSSPFWMGSSIRWYGDLSLPPMFMPVNALGDVMITTRDRKVVRMRVDVVGKYTIAEAERATWDAMAEASRPKGSR